MVKSFLSFILLISISVIVVGCRLAVIVVEGGEVRSDGAGTCVASSICIIDVTDTTFEDEFVAVPADGWYFQKWNLGSRFFCGGSTSTRCELSFQGHEESKAVADMVASSEMFYLMPVFRQYSDTIAVDGKEWAQVDLFTNLSWSDMNAVCPEGRCIDNEMLNGFDMTGWTWASIDDVNALFNYYIGSDVLGPGPDGFPVEYSTAGAFFNDGWRGTGIGDDTRGMVRNREESSGLVYHATWWQDFYTHNESFAQTHASELNAQQKSEIAGGWFYRTP